MYPLKKKMEISKTVLYAGGVIAVIIVFIILSKSTQKKQTYSAKIQTNVKFVTKEAARLQAASSQNTNVLLAVLDITSAVAYMKSLRRAFSSADITKISGINADEFINLLEEEQQKAIAKVMTQCPSMTPNTSSVDKTGWVA